MAQGTHSTCPITEHPNNDDTIVIPKTGRVNLQKDKQKALVHHLLEMQTNGVLPKGAIQKFVVDFRVSQNVVGRMWRQVKIGLENGDGMIDSSPKWKGNSGRKKKDRGQIVEAIKEIPIKQWKNM